MKEVEYESKWEDEGGAFLGDQSGAPNKPTAPVEVEHLANKLDTIITKIEQANETHLVLAALLMRIYDINMAQLSVGDKELADEVYDSHDAGGNFNPQLFVPDLKDTDE